MKSVSAFLFVTLVAFWSCSVCEAFARNVNRRSQGDARNSGYVQSNIPTLSKSALASGLFGKSENPLANLFRTNEKGPTPIFTIPAKEVKPGALRFLLQIFLVGEGNKPEKNTWVVKQSEEGNLEMYYSDGTGMVSLDLQEYNIRAIRYGERPSRQYQLQESMLLHGVLDELNSVTFEVDDIPEEKRLLRLADDEAIEKAREQLPARNA